MRSAPALLAFAALLLLAAPAAATPHAHHASPEGKGAKRSRRCKGSRALVKVGKRRGCRKPRLRGSAAHPPRTAAAVLKAATGAIAAARFQGGRAKQGRRAVRRLLDSRGMRDLSLLARRTSRAAAAPNLLAGASALRGPLATASADKVALPGGWTGTVDANDAAEEVTMTVRKGSDEASLTLRLPEPRLGHCPDADGVAAVENGYTFAIDARAPAPSHDGTLAFIHYALRESSESRGHTSDEARLHDFDFRAKAYQHIQVGLEDKTGEVLLTNRPWLATVNVATRYSAPFKALEAAEKAFEGHDKNAHERALRGVAQRWTGPGNQYNISDGAWDTGKMEPIGLPMGWILVDLLDTYKALKREQNAHWLVDCLYVDAETPNDELAAGSTAPLFVRVAARHGARVAPARIGASADVGTVAPASAAGGASPVRFDYTAPSSGWKSGTVTLRAASKQGAGKTTVSFSPPERTYVLRMSVAVDRQFLGGDAGTGSAAWRGGAESLLMGDGSGTTLSSATPTPFAWSTYSYEDKGVPMVCQAGGEGHEDAVGTRSDPGAFEVTSAAVFAGEQPSDEATIRFASPLDHYDVSFFPDATSCGASTRSSAFRFFDAYRARLGSQPGVTVHRPANGADLAGQAYVIEGWQAGGGAVEARRDFSWTDGEGGDEASSVHIALELIRQGDG